MYDHGIQADSPEYACLDQAVLGLMLDSSRQRPLSEAEIARAISIPGHVPDSLKRLRRAGFIHRWNDLATASHPAVRFHEITQPQDPGSEYERRHDHDVLECLLARSGDGERPLCEQEIREALGARKKKRGLAVADALDRLERAGLVERRGGRAIASQVARRLDQIMTR